MQSTNRNVSSPSITGHLDRTGRKGLEQFVRIFVCILVLSENAMIALAISPSGMHFKLSFLMHSRLDSHLRRSDEGTLKHHSKRPSTSSAKSEKEILMLTSVDSAILAVWGDDLEL